MPANYHSEKKKKEVNSNAGAGSGEVSRYSFFEGVQVLGRWKKIRRKRVPQPTSGREERVIVLVDSCERYLDRKGVRRYRKSCVARSLLGVRLIFLEFIVTRCRDVATPSPITKHG